jgi:tRNA:m4X modification enzyme
VPGSLYCGNHLPDSDVDMSKKSQKFKAATRRRVQCPVDGAHTVYEFDLAKHVLVCNRVKDADAMKKLPYYSHNINSGRHCTSQGEDKPSADEKEVEEKEQEQDENEHSAPSAQEQQGIIDRLVAIDFADLRKRIDAAYASCVGELALEKLHHKCCDQLFAVKKDAGASKSVLRHIEQQASIIGHMEQVKLLQDANAAFVELGAGRGMLSLALAQTFPDSLYVLIDRAHTRGKADRFIGSDGKADDAAKDSSTTLRAKIDIRHLNFAGMQEIVNKPVVCMSKHLCGVATDLSLRAIAQTLPESSSGKAEGSPTSVSSNFQGLAIALCCHHVCAWEDYVNPAFFQAQGFKPQEFALLTSMTSWTTCGMGLEGDAVQHILGIR